MSRPPSGPSKLYEATIDDHVPSHTAEASRVGPPAGDAPPKLSGPIPRPGPGEPVKESVFDRQVRERKEAAVQRMGTGGLEAPALAPGGLPPDLTALLEETLLRANEVSQDPERFTVYENDPLGFAEEILGVPRIDIANEIPGLWDRQCEILEAAVTESRIAVKSGHSIGKTYVAAILVIWWLYARKGLVVTTSSNWEQTERVLWREIHRLIGAARVPLPGENLKAERRVRLDWYAVGLNTDNPIAFRGRHHPRLLVVVDEANGVDDTIHDEIATLATGGGNCIVMIANPTVTSGAFYDAFKKGKWKRITASCLDHPNVVTGREIIPGAVTTEWVEDRRVKYGEDSPEWQFRVCGQFPTGSDKAVIASGWVERQSVETDWRAALVREQRDRTPVVFGVDVARHGSNMTTIAIRRGSVVEEVVGWTGHDLMESTGRIVLAAKQFEPTLIVVDEVGLGAGVVDRLTELGLPVTGWHSGRAAGNRTLFQNARSEAWWRMRERLKAGSIWLPPDADEQLLADLCAPTYKIGSTGKIQVERKEELAARGIASPDWADAVIMSLLYEDEAEPLKIAAGPNQDPYIFVPFEEPSFDMGQLPGGGW